MSRYGKGSWQNQLSLLWSSKPIFMLFQRRNLSTLSVQTSGERFFQPAALHSKLFPAFCTTGSTVLVVVVVGGGGKGGVKPHTPCFEAHNPPPPFFPSNMVKSIAGKQRLPQSLVVDKMGCTRPRVVGGGCNPLGYFPLQFQSERDKK